MTKNEQQAPDANMRLQALCHAPITVYVSAYAKYGEHGGPGWARFSLNVELLVCLWAMADVVKKQKLQSVCRRGDPDAWSEADPSDAIRLEGGLVQITDREEVRFLAEIRDAYTLVSTEPIELEELIEAAEGPAHVKTLVYQRCGSVLIMPRSATRRRSSASCRRLVSGSREYLRPSGERPTGLEGTHQRPPDCWAVVAAVAPKRQSAADDHPSPAVP